MKKKHHAPQTEEVTPEILAPAGNLASFAAAVDAGADAVYLGLKDFSARAYASNFSIADLARLVPLAHERNVKIFVAFNSILKEDDLLPAGRLLEAMAPLKPDALIIQDLGLFYLIKKHFPEFEVHASTLMAVHNQPGLQALDSAGFDRAVLARELTLREIGQISRKANIGLEVFIHGALCFSFSGLCLMSSFLGGKSSLRGACTQPCRRRYQSGKKSGYFFSMADLDSRPFIPAIKKMNLAALKIEGRMKGAHHVSSVVKAYRLMLDASDQDAERAMDEAGRLIASSLGRRGSSGFFSSPQPAEALEPHKAGTSGIFLGKVDRAAPEGYSLNLKADLKNGDRLRVQFKGSGEQKAFKLRQLSTEGKKAGEVSAGMPAVIQTDFKISKGDLLFKVDTARGEKDALNLELAKAFKNMRAPKIKNAGKFKLHGPDNKQKQGGRSSGRKPELWYRIAKAEDVLTMSPLRPDKIILPLTRSNVKRMARLHRKIKPSSSRLIVWALPPLIFEQDLDEFKLDLNTLKKNDQNSFMISNIGHFDLIRHLKAGRGKPIIYADHRLNCLNTACEAQLKSMGAAGVTISIESDRHNLEKIFSRKSSIDRLVYLYGQPALFTSRLNPPGLKDNIPLISPRGERFRIRHEREAFQLVAQTPVYLAPLIKSKFKDGIKALIIDLESERNPAEAGRRIKEAVSKNRPIKGASKFNYQKQLY